MRSVIYRALLVPLLLSIAIAGTDPLSLEISPAAVSVKSGDRLISNVTTTNKSNRQITYENIKTDCDYSIIVLTSAGVPAPETSLKRHLDCSYRGGLFRNRHILVTLKPGESNAEELDVSLYYDLSAPDRYSLQVNRDFPGLGRFTSNVVTVDVVPNTTVTARVSDLKFVPAPAYVR